LARLRLPDISRPIANALAPIGASVLTRSDEVTAEDIAGMVQLGVPGLSPSQDSRFYFSYHHSAADTLDKVNVQQLNENAAVMAVTAYALADASEAITSEEIDSETLVTGVKSLLPGKSSRM